MTKAKMNNLTEDELERLAIFASCVVARPDLVRKHAKIARGQGNLWNGYGPGAPSFELDEAFKFIEDFIRLNPDKYLVEKLTDDMLLSTAEVMRIVIEGYEATSCSQAPNWDPYIKSAEALREAALKQRELNGYSREEWEDEYPERD